jgi:hypothetical protein
VSTGFGTNRTLNGTNGKKYKKQETRRLNKAARQLIDKPGFGSFAGNNAPIV